MVSVQFAVFQKNRNKVICVICVVICGIRFRSELLSIVKCFGTDENLVN